MALNEIYKEVPFVISSGYRCHANNVANGGAKYSPHLFGWAADCVVPTIEQKKVFIDAVKQICHNPGIGQYANYPRLVHVDMTPIQRPAEWTK